MAAKKGPHYQMGTAHRDKIKNSNILNALIEHAEGKREMSGTQVTAGLGLLKKVMPDLTHNENENTHGLSDPLADLLRQVAENGKRVGKD